MQKVQFSFLSILTQSLSGGGIGFVAVALCTTSFFLHLTYFSIMTSSFSFYNPNGFLKYYPIYKSFNLSNPKR